VNVGRGVLTATLLLAAAGAAQAESPSAHAVEEGRYHLRKANSLAGDDRCQAAVHEYTLAYKKLRDPVVLFNRAECYRRIGEGEKAVADYRAFLEAVPSAPNRAQIEAKIATQIAALDAKPSPVAGPGPARRNGPGPDRATAPPLARSLATAPPPPPSEKAPVIDDAPLPASAASPPAVTLVEPGPAASPPSDNQGHRGKTWLWIAVGAAVAGGAVGAYFALRTPTTVPPTTDLGNYKF
jgi:tetratricopeptide (TPR) repeat protein